MKKLLRLLILILLLLYNTANSQDLGIRDTLRIECDSLIVGQSVPVTFHIFNDNPLRLIYTGFYLAGNEITYDSVKYVGRMEDPNVLDLRSFWYREKPVDSLFFGPYRILKDNLPAGSGEIIELYLTAQDVGIIEIDSFTHPIGNQWGFFDNTYIQPYFVPAQIEIKKATPIPWLIVDTNLAKMLNTETIDIGFIASSPDDLATTVTLKSIVDINDSSNIPSTQPEIHYNLDSTISWSPGVSDIGIWEITIEACNVLGYCVQRRIQVQVVSNEKYLPEFTHFKFDNVINITGLTIGNFDSDIEYELAATGLPWNYTPSFAIINFDMSLETIKIPYSSNNLYTAFSPYTVFTNSNNYQEIYYYSLVPISSSSISQSILTVKPTPYGNIVDTNLIDNGYKISSMGRFNNDNIIDYISYSGLFLRTFIFDGETYILSNSYPVTSTVLSINVADFNHDHFDDFAFSTLDGFYVYLNDKMGNFTQSDFYPQEFGGSDIEITNQGTDFNKDHNFDICVSAPSVGGTHSEIIVYTGNPDGTFNKYLSKRVIGQVFGCTAGDINNDDYIDIFYINGSKKYFGILFGDETGSFANEVQYYIDGLSPKYIKSFDIDLDGDLDIVVSTFDGYRSNELHVYDNLSYSMIELSEISIELSGVGDVQLTAPSGKYLDRNASTFATGSSAYWQTDNGGISDRKYVVKEVEQGEYTLDVKRVETETSSFILEATVENKKFRFNTGEDCNKPAYRFRFTPSGNSSVYPESGGFAHDSLVTFIWNTTGPVNFQLSSDLDFNNILVDTIVDNNQYAFTNPTFDTDTVTLYWRYFTGSIDPTVPINVANLVSPVPTDMINPDGQLPTEFSLSANYPNPFNPSTQIDYSLPNAEIVTLKIYNLNGQLVRTLVNEQKTAGKYIVSWDGTNDNGGMIATGIYLYKMTAGSFTKARKMVLMK